MPQYIQTKLIYCGKMFIIADIERDIAVGRMICKLNQLKYKGWGTHNEHSKQNKNDRRKHLPKDHLFAIPLLLGNLFQQLYNTADSLIVGNFLGSNALAAVSSSSNLIF